MTDKKKYLLILVTGMSPQVVTETLYGIQEADMPWPDEIEILTTKKGKEQARLGLLSSSDGESCMLDNFCQDYDKKLPTLTEANIFSIPDASGVEVDDARTKEDQEALADYIIRHVATRCADDNIRIHASIAGGRKTMTFYLGYAMSLFARPGDMLTHVLVDEAYEGNREFYYPTPVETKIKGKNENEYLDASKAHVMLAEIPFIRQRSQLNKNVLTSLQNESYRELVLCQNALNEIKDIKLTIDYRNRQIVVMDKVIPFDDSLMELAFIGMIAEHVKTYIPSMLFKPVKDSNVKEFIHLSELFLVQMEKIANIKTKKIIEFDQENHLLRIDHNEFKKDFRSRAEALTDRNLVKGSGLLSNEPIARTYLELEGGMTEAFFSDRLTKLKKKLQKYFPADFVHCLTPAQVYEVAKNGGVRNKKRDYSTKGQQNTPYGLWLNNDNIEMITY